MSTVERTNATFRQASLLLALGMCWPAAPVAAAGALIAAAVDYYTFLAALSLPFGLVAVALIDRLDWDRPTFLVVAVVQPWVVFFVALLAVLLLNRGEQIPRGPVADVFRTLVGSRFVWDADPPAFAYGTAFAAAGVGAVALSTLLDRAAADSTERGR